MKSKDIAKLHSDSKEELATKLAALQKSLVEARMQLSLHKEKNLKKMTLIRADIARIKTIMSEIELASKAKAK